MTKLRQAFFVQACIHFEAQTQDELRYAGLIMQTTEQASKQRIKWASKTAIARALS
jgi:hypothetical protein